ncbi:glutathione S-transferase P 1-like [Lineus longissimus]|uniref:glutathione S-transferase P 1-like n=1 Tax=Lineus longissimus TaxID=88925 RepID=UPI002B4EEF8B
MSSPVYEYHYFGHRGIRGRHIRTILRDQKIPFVEHVHDHDNWEDFKATLPFGSTLPLLKDGDFTLLQSNAILRYLGRKHDLYGDNLKEAARIDMINDGVEDLRIKFVMQFFMAKDMDESDEAEYVKNIPKSLEPFEKLLAENDGGAGFMVGKKISFLDFNLFDILETHLQVLDKDCLSEVPLLQAYHERMASRPIIKACRELSTWSIKNRFHGRTFWV